MTRMANLEARGKNRGEQGFTLAEAVISVLILTICILALCATISFSQRQRANSRDRATMGDFLTHYVETLRGVDFASLQAGTPINTLYDGSGGAPLIALPTNNSWISLDTADYRTFHPDLVSFTGRHPLLRITLTVTQQGGVDYMKHVCLELKWDPPLNKGSTQNMRGDTLFTKDL